MPDQEDELLTTEEAFRAAYHYILQYYGRERITPFMLMLHSMYPYGEDVREANDPASWHDWVASVEKARLTPDLPYPDPPTR
jgi:hypothetical protein